MRSGAGRTQLRVRGQGRAYAAVLGVTVGMLVAGLAVPLTFGRVPGPVGGSSQAAVQLDQDFATGATPAPVGSAAPAPTGGASTRPSVAISTAPRAISLASRTPGPRGVLATPVGRASPRGAGLTATDQGVTASTVTVGFVLLDIEALKPLGFAEPHFTPADQRQQYQVLVDQVNRAGGLSGRRVVPDFVTYNALDANGSQSPGAVCIQLAENDKVFAVMGVLDGGIAECLTSQYGIPALAHVGHLAEAYRKGRHLLVSPSASLERGTADWGDLAARSGLLRGRRSATVSTAVPQEALPEQSLTKALSSGGQPVTYRSRLSGDPGTAQSQIPVEVQKMQQARVDTVFLVTSFVTALQWAQAAERQGFRPLYVVSDLGSLTGEGLVRSMPASFDGAYAFTQAAAGEPEGPADARCRQQFDAASGQSYAPGDDSRGLRRACWLVLVLQDAADLVGPDLTRARLGTAFQERTSTVSLPYSLPGSFTSGKTDFADDMRPERYASSCRCYRPAGAPQRGTY